jgi:tetratricopeptide (TPR) repeat protein
MRTLKLLPLFVVVCSFAATASAQQVGDKIVVIAENAALRSNNDTTGTVPKGHFLVIQNVDGDRLSVIYSSGHATVEGWIKRSDVIPLSQALDLFSDELKRTPSSVAYTIRGTIWNEQRDFDKAIIDFNQAIRLDPKNPRAYIGRGLAWVPKHEWNKAISDFTEAIRLDPKDASVHMCRGLVWHTKKEFEKAIWEYDESIRLDPRFASSYGNRALAWSAKGDIDKAISDYDEVIRLDPSAVAYNNRGNTWSDTKEYDKAIADYDEAIRLDPKYVYAYINRGRAWRKTGKYAKALSDYDEVLRLDPKEGRSYWGLAWLYATCPDAKYRDGKKAVDNAEKARQLLGSTDNVVAVALAAAYAEVGDFDSAVKWQTKARDLVLESQKADYHSRLDLYKAHKRIGMR